MARTVKARTPTRPYDSTRRQEQARATRRRILDAAHRRFLDHGYAATTMPAVAADAGVSVETVYKSFRNKAGLVKAVFDVSIVGDDEAVPMLEREMAQRLAAEPDARTKLRGYGAHLVAAGSRSFPLQLVVRNAAAADESAAEVWRQMLEERLTGMTRFAQHLAEGRHLRRGVSVEQARDVLWTYNSVELWDLLVNERAWTNEQWGTWVGEQLIAALLEDAA